MKTTKVLVVVDYQKDFASPEGALYVPEAETIAQLIQREIDSGEYADIIYTLDTHVQRDYAESAESEMFPPHCEFGTEGWRLFEISPKNPGVNAIIQSSIFDSPTDFSVENEFVFVKDKFSIWEGNGGYESFISTRYHKGFTEFVVVGVATNYCVFQNAMGYRKLGFESVTILESATKGILDDTFERNIETMKSQDIRFI